MKEEIVVKYITDYLDYLGRYYVNVHGSEYSLNGTPDLLTHDKNNIFVAIEAKAPKQSPKLTQWQHAIKILNSGGRYIVAQDDIDIDKMDNEKLPIIEIGSKLGESEFEANQLKLKQSYEIKLRNH